MNVRPIPPYQAGQIPPPVQQPIPSRPGVPPLASPPQQPPMVIQPQSKPAVPRGLLFLGAVLAMLLMLRWLLRLQEAENLTWNDLDFPTGHVHVTRKSASGWVQAWRPKDHEMRTVPLPSQALDLLTALQADAPEGCPYVFMEAGRWDYYQEQVAAKQWRAGQDLVNNLLRRLMTLCRKAGVGPYTFHDLRRSCITNWAQQLPIHVVQQLAGHSDIKTTQQYYLAVRPEDVAKAQAIQSSLLGSVPASTPTDQKLTNSAKKRVFPGRKVIRKRFQPQ